MTDFRGQAMREIDALILADPAQYERLLRSWQLLLGNHPRSWWAQTVRAADGLWERAIRKAVAITAARISVPAAGMDSWLDLTDEFDEPVLPGARATVRRLALALLDGAA